MSHRVLLTTVTSANTTAAITFSVLVSALFLGLCTLCFWNIAEGRDVDDSHSETEACSAIFKINVPLILYWITFAFKITLILRWSVLINYSDFPTKEIGLSGSGFVVLSILVIIGHRIWSASWVYYETRSSLETIFQFLDLKMLKETHRSFSLNNPTAILQSLSRLAALVQTCPLLLLTTLYIMSDALLKSDKRPLTSFDLRQIRAPGFSLSSWEFAFLIVGLIQVLYAVSTSDSFIVVEHAKSHCPPSPFFTIRLVLRLVEIVTRIFILSLLWISFKTVGFLIVFVIAYITHILIWRAGFLGNSLWYTFAHLFAVPDLGIYADERVQRTLVETYVTNILDVIVFSCVSTAEFRKFCISDDDGLPPDAQRIDKNGFIIEPDDIEGMKRLKEERRERALAEIRPVVGIDLLWGRLAQNFVFIVMSAIPIFTRIVTSEVLLMWTYIFGGLLTILVLVGLTVLVDALDMIEYNRVVPGDGAATVLAAIGDIEQLKDMSKVAPEMLGAKDKMGMTPAMSACSNGHLECLTFLYEFGVDLRVENDDHQTVLHIAAQNGHARCLKLLVDIGEEGDLDIDLADKNRQTPLILAARYKHPKCVQVLCEDAVNMDWRDKEGKTAAYWACESNDSSSLRILAEVGCNLNTADEMELTPAFVAVEKGHNDCLRVLVEFKADVSQGQAALNSATGLKEIVRMESYQLLGMGASGDVL